MNNPKTNTAIYNYKAKNTLSLRYSPLQKCQKVLLYMVVAHLYLNKNSLLVLPYKTSSCYKLVKTITFVEFILSNLMKMSAFVHLQIGYLPAFQCSNLGHN